MLVNVTQADLDNGRPDDCDACALALALFRATGQRWVVDPAHLYRLRPDGIYRSIALPDEARRLVRAFDEGRARPCTVDLPIPEAA